MSVHRHFYPNGMGESIVWLPVPPGSHDAFRDFSTGGLGRLVITECDTADNGGVISLFDSETKAVKAKHLDIPVIELPLEESKIILDEGDEYELPIVAKQYGQGVLLFRHDPARRIKQLL